MQDQPTLVGRNIDGGMGSERYDDRRVQLVSSHELTSCHRPPPHRGALSSQLHLHVPPD